jgi:hypothetical protein
MNVERLLSILHGRIRTHEMVFKMITDCYRSGSLPCMGQVNELTTFSSVVSVLHEAILLQVCSLAAYVWSILVPVGSPVYYHFCFASTPGQNQGV